MGTGRGRGMWVRAGGATAAPPPWGRVRGGEVCPRRLANRVKGVRGEDVGCRVEGVGLRVEDAFVLREHILW